MSYRRTKELAAMRDRSASPRNKTPGFSSTKSPARTGQTRKSVAPEDNWELVGNPSVLFDELPQPYRFINKCLTELIMKPVN